MSPAKVSFLQGICHVSYDILTVMCLNSCEFSFLGKLTAVMVICYGIHVKIEGVRVCIEGL